jgi:prevent-host-death family protein
MKWQVQEAKQKFSEVVRRAIDEGPQMVTRHGAEVVVILEAEEFHRLKGDLVDFKTFLQGGPNFDLLEIERDRSLSRRIDLKA